MTPDVVVDVGNTRVKWGRCGPGGILHMASLSPEPSDDWSNQIAAWSLPDQAHWILAGVHPKRRDALASWLRERRYSVTILESYRQLPLEIRVEAPERVGIDRLLNAVAVKSGRAHPGQSAILVDAGSAVTVDRLDSDGAFRGGAIFPGLRLMAEALHRYTAKLPRIEVRDLAEYPGTSTEKAMSTGIINAVAGGIEKIVREHGHDCRVFLTGGDAVLIEQALRSVHGEVWPEMTLEGLRLAARYANENDASIPS